MKFRFVSNKAITRLKALGTLQRSQCDYYPYKPNEVICFFDADDVIAYVKQYGDACAAGREDAAINGRLEMNIIVLTDLDEELIEIDKSQAGWIGACAYHNDIPATSIQKIGTFQIIVGKTGLTNLDSTSIIIYDQPQEI